ncbi:YihY/virulence factor BrkB family protein [Verrucomicrobiaceae bacterium N1E253]|uniref:YihY/virulence factor BrkB family protein n=1 Tax=Oceaniferula marina TaxID=2748318 RepID=A0A851GSQ9_9BACT|nr:YhjD/YihY/BrkB family envelope integrity protein [Oceaniferula marina]NWK57284.1 YihY/virulence factor BrkB family protein [Oceaniferula marina]
MWSKIGLWCGHLLQAAKMWWRHKHADEAAALAFYSLISLVPILLVGIFIASFFVDEKVATQILLSEAHHVAGSTVANYFAQILRSDVQWAGSGFSPVIGMFFLFFSATKVIAELRKSLGKVFGSPRKKGRKAALAGLIGRLASALMLCALGVFIASAVIFETLMGVLVDEVFDASWMIKLATYISPLFSFCAMTLLSAVAMRWLPARPPKFREAVIGGAVSAMMLVGLKIGLAKFLKHSDFGSFYGSAVTLVLVLFWIYFAMQVFLYGAELAAELAMKRRAKESPDEEDDPEGLLPEADQNTRNEKSYVESEKQAMDDDEGETMHRHAGVGDRDADSEGAGG